MGNRLRVTVCELPDDPAQFEEVWSDLAGHVRAEGSHLVLLPELPAGRWPGHRPVFDPEVWSAFVAAHDRLIERLADLSSATVLGTRPVERAGRRLNQTFAWRSAEGMREAHAKACLPEEAGFYEASWFTPGGAPTVLDLPGVRVGFQVCTEAMYPERARLLGRAGAQLIATPRATSGHGRWRVAPRMNAIVSGAFVLSSNRTGPGELGSDLEFGGRGLVVSPDGDVLAETSPAQPFITCTIDLQDADQARTTYPRNVTVDGQAP